MDEELPIELPSRFELTVNRKTADALGLSIPQSILLRADRVIERRHGERSTERTPMIRAPKGWSSGRWA